MSLLCFAITSIILGALMIYIGKKGTRTLGIVLLIVGVVVSGVCWQLYSPNLALVFHGVVSLIGAIVGMVIAVVLFLVGFMLI